MKALRLTCWGKRAQMTDVSIPEPGPGQVRIKIAGAGACHSDLHLMEWQAGTLPLEVPFTLGHENAGIVDKLGAGVTGLVPGDAVLVHGSWGCGACRPCRLGRENYCERASELVAMGGGLGCDGGMAEYMVVPNPRLLIPLGDLDPVEAAPLADAALTPYAAIEQVRDRLFAGANAAVIGCGGLGQMAIQLLRATTGARVIAYDHDDRKLETARALGADVLVRPSDPLPPCDVVLDMVGSDGTLVTAARALRAEGRLVIVGLAGGTLPVTFLSLPFGASVSTSYWGTATELMDVVALARAGRIHVDVQRFPLAHAMDAYDQLRRGEIRGRAVVTP
jgi:propanol-preferring alcohol dehydrogenase